ncbi:MAG: site-2 protease family protein [Promethearchaeota archaeon]
MKIGTIKGIGIKIHLSTLLIVGLVGFYAASFYISINNNAPFIEIFTVGLLNGLIILISILIHELSHSIMAQRYGLEVKEIELYIFGGVSKIEEEPKTPNSEMLITFVGPLSSLLTGGILLIINLLPLSAPALISFTLFYSGISNIGLGIFNLLPAFPIDGGRILRALLWKRRNNLISATRTASNVGVIVGYGLIVYGIFQIFTLGFINGLWLILMGSFLNSSARQSYTQTVNDVALSSITAKEIVNLPNFKIPFEINILEALRSYFFPYKKSYFPVVQDYKIVGLVHIEDIKKIPIEQRSNIIIGYVMRKISEFPYVNIDDTGKEVMKKLRKSGKKPYIGIVRERENGALIGFIAEEDLISSLKFWDLNQKNLN